MTLIATLFWAMVYYLFFAPVALLWRGMNGTVWRRKPDGGSAWRVRARAEFGPMDRMR